MFKPGQSGNPAGRPVGKTALAAFREYCSPRWSTIVDKLIELAEQGDMKAIEVVASRMVTAPKAIGESVSLPGLREAATIEEKADLILAAVSEGRVTVEGGRQALAMLADYARAKSVDDLERRLRAIEERTGRAPKRITQKVEDADLV